MDIYGLFCLAKYITTCIYWRYYRVKSDFLETLICTHFAEVALGECLRILRSEEECTRAELERKGL